MRTRVIAATMLGLAVAVPTSTAFAVTITAAGSKAWSPADGGNTGKVAAQDTQKDGDPVKAQYYRRSDPNDYKTLWNHSGEGTIAYSADGSTIYQIRTCESRDLDPDVCSGWSLTGY
jgi:hypothetical protein